MRLPQSLWLYQRPLTYTSVNESGESIITSSYDPYISQTFIYTSSQELASVIHIQILSASLKSLVHCTSRETWLISMHHWLLLLMTAAFWIRERDYVCSYGGLETQQQPLDTFNLRQGGPLKEGRPKPLLHCLFKAGLLHQYTASLFSTKGTIPVSREVVSDMGCICPKDLRLHQVLRCSGVTFYCFSWRQNHIYNLIQT